MGFQHALFDRLGLEFIFPDMGGTGERLIHLAELKGGLGRNIAFRAFM